ncbi:glycosyltransferase [Rhodobacterales bacterium HKCCD6035]|nr:glycosyltransferase [Rhodobacterales bacterium HKCCD6035]
MNNKINLSFLWIELPDYAARSLAYLASAIDDKYNVNIIATRPSVPIEGMDEVLGNKLYWIPFDSEPCWSDLGLPVPDILFVAGYNYLPFKTLHFEVLERGVTTVLMSDENWAGGVRCHVFEPIRHRIFFRSKFDAVMVPGSSGARLAHRLGYEYREIFEGLYGADPNLFYSRQPLLEREKKLIFVGQLNRRKDVARLADAFVCCSQQMPGWSLDIYGVGPLSGNLPNHEKITYHGFKQPHEIAAAMREARCFVLPSLQENWGLVVHEAALSGCALILSDRVGARHDLAGEHNAIIFEAGNTAALKSALLKMSSWDDERWQIAEAYSLQVANRFGPYRFAQSAMELLSKHGYSRL